ncbi:MAG: DMT family transporter [Muribaculaceae bacterium]|nr:DMT family transporter [Muribaculaceae bacterium]
MAIGLGKLQKKVVLAHAEALFAVGVWGATFVSTKILLEQGMNAVEIYIYRFLLAYLLLIPFTWRKIFANNLRDEILFLLLGLTSGAIYFIAENTALMYTLAGNVSLITSVSPLLTVLLIGLFYKSERPTRGVLFGSCIALLGVACVVFNSGFNMQVNPLGDMLALGAAFSWAFYCIILRKVNANYSALFITRKSFFYGIVTALPFLAFETHFTSPARLLEPEILWNMLFLGVIASMLCYYLWALAMKVVGTVKINNYMYLQPVFTLVLAYFILAEHISALGYTGCFLILTGLYLSEKLAKKGKN